MTTPDRTHQDAGLFERLAEDIDEGADRLTRIAHRLISDSEKLRERSNELREKMMKNQSV